MYVFHSPKQKTAIGSQETEPRPSNIIQIDQNLPGTRLDRLITEKVTELLDAMLDLVTHHGVELCLKHSVVELYDFLGHGLCLFPIAVFQCQRLKIVPGTGHVLFQETQITKCTEIRALPKDGENPDIHSDRGCHYRWPEWIRIRKEHDLSHSMSAKVCSPDSAAVEGFFGRPRQEFFHKRGFAGVSLDGLIGMLDEYMV